jgi:hypothetical protein
VNLTFPSLDAVASNYVDSHSFSQGHAHSQINTKTDSFLPFPQSRSFPSLVDIEIGGISGASASASASGNAATLKRNNTSVENFLMLVHSGCLSNTEADIVPFSWNQNPCANSQSYGGGPKMRPPPPPPPHLQHNRPPLMQHNRPPHPPQQLDQTAFTMSGFHVFSGQSQNDARRSEERHRVGALRSTSVHPHPLLMLNNGPPALQAFIKEIEMQRKGEKIMSYVGSIHERRLQYMNEKRLAQAVAVAKQLQATASF